MVVAENCTPVCHVARWYAHRTFHIASIDFVVTCFAPSERMNSETDVQLNLWHSSSCCVRLVSSISPTTMFARTHDYLQNGLFTDKYSDSRREWSIYDAENSSIVSALCRFDSITLISLRMSLAKYAPSLIRHMQLSKHTRVDVSHTCTAQTPHGQNITYISLPYMGRHNTPEA